MSDLSTPEENAPAEVAPASSQRGFALPEPIAHREGLFGAGTDSSTSGFAGLVTDSFLPGEASRPYGGSPTPSCPARPPAPTAAGSTRSLTSSKSSSPPMASTSPTSSKR